MVGFLGFYRLVASFAGAQTQYAAINAKNNLREGTPKPTDLATFMRGNTAPVTRSRANGHTAKAVEGILTSGRKPIHRELAQGLGAEGLRRRSSRQDGGDTDAIGSA